MKNKKNEERDEGWRIFYDFHDFDYTFVVASVSLLLSCHESSELHNLRHQIHEKKKV